MGTGSTKIPPILRQATQFAESGTFKNQSAVSLAQSLAEALRALLDDNTNIEVITAQFLRQAAQAAGQDNETSDEVSRVSQTQAIINQLNGISDIWKARKQNLSATTDPKVTDDTDLGYSVFSPWVNLDENSLWFCLDNSSGAAIWQRVGSSSHAFALSATSGGTVTAESYLSPGTEPANKVLIGLTSDHDTVNFAVEIYVEGQQWQPTSVYLQYRTDAGSFSTVHTILREDWVQNGTDHRSFTVTLTHTGGSADGIYRILTSDGGASPDIDFTRALDAPNVTSGAWDGTYPTDGETGLQTAVKDGDTVTVSGDVETHATRITVTETGATAGHGSTQVFDDDYSGGTYSISVEIGSGTGSKQFTLEASIGAGSPGDTPFTTTSTAIVLDQASHSYSSFGTLIFLADASNFALASGHAMTGVLTISNWVIGDDVIAYTSSEITITSSTDYLATKTYTYLSGTYNDSTDNVTITSRRKANGKQSTTTYLCKIANTPPTLTMTGATTRLRSRTTPSDKSYNLTLTGSQELKDTPTVTRDAADDGDALSGAWTGAEPDKTWTHTIFIGEEDTKNVGGASHDWAGVAAINGAGTSIASAVINTNPTYEVGGFEERDIAIAQFTEYGPIGTMVSNKDNANKLICSAVGIGTLTYKANTTQNDGGREFTIVDSGGTFDADGDYVRCTDGEIFNLAYTIRIEEST